MNFFKSYFTAQEFASAKNVSVETARFILEKLVKRCEAEYITCYKEDRLRTFKRYRLLP